MHRRIVVRTLLSLGIVALVVIAALAARGGRASESRGGEQAARETAGSAADAPSEGADEHEPREYADPAATDKAARTRLLANGPVTLSKAAAPSAPTASSLSSFSGFSWPGGAWCSYFSTAGCYPPDTTLGKSSNRVVEGVNGEVLLTNNSGTVLDSRTLVSFMGLGSPASFHQVGFDPRVIYDRNASRPRFYVAALTTNDKTTSTVQLAISRSPDPSTLTTADWCRYTFQGVSGGGTSDAAWADYPEIGVGPDGLIVTTNQYRFSDGNFMYARVRILQKLIANNNASACPAASSFSLGTWRLTSSNTDWTRITVIPSLAYTTAPSFAGVSYPIYMVATPITDASGQTPGMPVSANYYRIWRVSNIGSGVPKFESTTVSGNWTYTTPPSGVQSGGLYPTDTFDTRGMATVSLGSSLYYVHQTQCQFTGGSLESCLRIMRFTVGQSGSGSLAASISQQLTSGPGDGWYLSHPNIAVNQSGQMALTTQAVSASTNLSSWWAIKNASATNWSFNLLSQGTCANDPEYHAAKGRVRVGDYTGAATEPYYLNTFWVAGEAANQVGTSGCHWTTRIAHISP